jgi:hypothetical protein
MPPWQEETLDQKRMSVLRGCFPKQKDTMILLVQFIFGRQTNENLEHPVVPTRICFVF